MTVNNANERTTLFIDGSNFYAALALNMDIDYAECAPFLPRTPTCCAPITILLCPRTGILSPTPSDRLAGLQWLCRGQQADA